MSTRLTNPAGTPVLQSLPHPLSQPLALRLATTTAQPPRGACTGPAWLRSGREAAVTRTSPHAGVRVRRWSCLGTAGRGTVMFHVPALAPFQLLQNNPFSQML